MNIISGLYNEGQIRVGIVATRFNEVVVSKLIDGAADGLSRHGVDMDTVDEAKDNKHAVGGGIHGYCRSGVGAGSI